MRASPPDPFRLDRAAVRAGFERAGASYDEAAVLQAHVRTELLARLALVDLAPRAVLDLGAGTGQGAGALRRRFPRALVVALDSAPGMLRRARRHGSWLRPLRRLCADAQRLPLRDGSVDLVFSNLLLHWAEDPDAVLAEVRRVLAPEGFFAFSTLGPDTLRELRAAWAAADDGVHVMGLRDMHDVGDALSRAGFAEPVLDVERVTVTYADVATLRRDLKAAGAGNATSARARGLTSPRRWRRMVAAYEAQRRDGLLPATCEVIYGAAWSGGPWRAPAAQPGETHIPVQAIGRRTRP